MRLKCTAGRAMDDLERWHAYVDGHAQVLRDFGIEVLTSYGEDWINNPNVYLIIASDEHDNVVGGIKVHKVSEGFQLPVQQAIGDLAPEIDGIIHDNEIFGAGEICGLWISKNAGRRGLANFLTRVAIAICSPLQIRKIYGIASPFTLNMFFSMGYEIMHELGNDGNFHYPTPEFTSAAVKIEDTFELPLASNIHKERIFDLRNNPVQSSAEEHLSIITEIDYNLSALFSYQSSK